MALDDNLLCIIDGYKDYKVGKIYSSEGLSGDMHFTTCDECVTLNSQNLPLMLPSSRFKNGCWNLALNTLITTLIKIDSLEPKHVPHINRKVGKLCSQVVANTNVEPLGVADILVCNQILQGYLAELESLKEVFPGLFSTIYSNYPVNDNNSYLFVYDSESNEFTLRDAFFSKVETLTTMDLLNPTELLRKYNLFIIPDVMQVSGYTFKLSDIHQHVYRLALYNEVIQPLLDLEELLEELKLIYNTQYPILLGIFVEIVAKAYINYMKSNFYQETGDLRRRIINLINKAEKILEGE